MGVGGGEEAHRFLHLRKIWVLDPAGAAPAQQLTEDPRYRDEEPLWSADSSHILFARMDCDCRTSLWLMESNGSNAQPGVSVVRSTAVSNGRGLVRILWLYRLAHRFRLATVAQTAAPSFKPSAFRSGRVTGIAPRHPPTPPDVRFSASGG